MRIIEDIGKGCSRFAHQGIHRQYRLQTKTKQLCYHIREKIQGADTRIVGAQKGPAYYQEMQESMWSLPSKEPLC